MHEHILLAVHHGGIQAFREAHTKHHIAEKLEIEIFRQPELLPEMTANIRVRLLLDRVQVRVARGQRVHRLVELPFEFLA